jgi:hypothetical protein
VRGTDAVRLMCEARVSKRARPGPGVRFSGSLASRSLVSQQHRQSRHSLRGGANARLDVSHPKEGLWKHPGAPTAKLKGCATPVKTRRRHLAPRDVAPTGNAEPVCVGSTLAQRAAQHHNANSRGNQEGARTPETSIRFKKPKGERCSPHRRVPTARQLESFGSHLDLANTGANLPEDTPTPLPRTDAVRLMCDARQSNQPRLGPGVSFSGSLGGLRNDLVLDLVLQTRST